MCDICIYTGYVYNILNFLAFYIHNVVKDVSRCSNGEYRNDVFVCVCVYVNTIWLDIYNSVFVVIFMYIIQFRPTAGSTTPVTSVTDLGQNGMVSSLGE